MNNQIIIPELNNETIESMIYVIRGVKVMLDFDLAKIYGYETRRFNEQVKNNIERFDNDFRFQLTRNELSDMMMSKKSTSRNINYFSGNTGGTRKLPYAFTEQGIYMLMTVLKGELAVKQSKTIIRLFKQMKDYIVETNNVISTNEILKLTNIVYDTRYRQDKTDKKIENIIADNKSIKKQLEVVMDNFIDPSKYKHFLIFDGSRLEADVAYQEIYKMASKSIYIIDDYIDIKTLQLLKSCKGSIDIIIFSDNKAKNRLTKDFINDFIKDTNITITFKKTNNKIHDRFIILDYKTDKEMIYLCGSSSKDSGSRITTITRIETVDIYHDFIDNILTNSELKL